MFETYLDTSDEYAIAKLNIALRQNETGVNGKNEIQQQEAHISKALSPIAKDAEVKASYGPTYKYQGIVAVMNAMKPLCEKFEVNMDFVVLRHVVKNGPPTKSGKPQFLHFAEVLIKSVSKKDGSYTWSISEGESLDTADKGTAKVITAAYRDYLYKKYVISTKDLAQQDQEATVPDCAPTANTAKKYIQQPQQQPQQPQQPQQRNPNGKPNPQDMNALIQFIANKNIPQEQVEQFLQKPWDHFTQGDLDKLAAEFRAKGIM